MRSKESKWCSLEAKGKYHFNQANTASFEPALPLRGTMQHLHATVHATSEMPPLVDKETSTNLCEMSCTGTGNSMDQDAVHRHRRARARRALCAHSLSSGLCDV